MDKVLIQEDRKQHIVYITLQSTILFSSSWLLWHSVTKTQTHRQKDRQIRRGRDGQTDKALEAKRLGERDKGRQQIGLQITLDMNNIHQSNVSRVFNFQL